MQWETIISSIEPLEIKFKQSYKCLNQNRPIQSETLNKHITILIESFNNIREILNRQYDRYSTQHKEQADKIFFKLRDKLLKIFHKHNIHIKVPLTLSCEVDKKIIESDDSEQEDFEEDKEIQPTTMTRSEDEVIDKTTKIVPTFDGNVDELQSFLDALTIVEKIKDTHEEIAIGVIKTKLKGQARNLITNEDSIVAIRSKLESNIQGESSEVLCSKLMNIKQQSKSATSYAEEIQQITKKLFGAYIREGYPYNISEKLIKQNVTKAISKNAANEEVKLIMKTGNFASLNEVVSKFIEASTEAITANSSVFYFKRPGSSRQNHENRFNNYRGNGNSWRRNNHFNGSNNNNNFNNNNSWRRGNNHNRNQAHHSRNGGRVRMTQGVSGNEIPPQDMGGQS